MLEWAGNGAQSSKLESRLSSKLHSTMLLSVFLTLSEAFTFWAVLVPVKGNADLNLVITVTRTWRANFGSWESGLLAILKSMVWSCIININSVPFEKYQWLFLMLLQQVWALKLKWNIENLTDLEKNNFGLQFYRKRKWLTRIYYDTGGLWPINYLFPRKKKQIASYPWRLGIT